MAGLRHTMVSTPGPAIRTLHAGKGLVTQTVRADLFAGSLPPLVHAAHPLILSMPAIVQAMPSLPILIVPESVRIASLGTVPVAEVLLIARMACLPSLTVPAVA